MTKTTDRFGVPLYSVFEAARYLGVPTSTFTTWAHGRPAPERAAQQGDW